ncbi:MAG: four helix bundle protein [Actinomycetota bacterium]
MIAVIARHRDVAVIVNDVHLGSTRGKSFSQKVFGMSLDKHHALRDRTKAFALRVIRMSQALPRNREANVICQQILRSATGIAANYRAAGRSRSKAEFVAKIGVVIEEADETVFWLEMLADSGLVRPQKLAKLQIEANELLAIFAASRRTARD